MTRAERIAGELSEEDRGVIARLPADGSMRLYKPGSKGAAVKLAKRFDFEVVAFTTGYGMIYLTRLGREVQAMILKQIAQIEVKPMKVLVCGGRDWRDRGQIHYALNGIHAETPITELIHGAARGVDTIAAEWARATGGIKVRPFPADWDRDGLAAGPIRNQRMLDEGKPDLVVVFPGGKGTLDMACKAVRNGVKIVRPVAE